MSSTSGKGHKRNNLNSDPKNSSEPPKPLPRSKIVKGKRPPNSASTSHTNHDWPEKDSGAYNNQKYKDDYKFLPFEEKLQQKIYEKDVEQSISIVKQEGNPVPTSLSQTNNEWAENMSASCSEKYPNNDTETIAGHEVSSIKQGRAQFSRGREKNRSSTNSDFPKKDTRSFDPREFQNNCAETKKNLEDAISENLPYLCTTCEKSIHKKALSQHRGNIGHEILPVDLGIAKLQEKKLREAYNLEKMAKSILLSKNQVAETLDSSLNSIIDPLLDAFECLKKSTLEETNDLTAFLCDIEEFLPEKNLDFVQFLKLKNDMKKLEAKGDILLLKNQCMPFWLLSSWFKISLGLMLQSGKIICTIWEDKAISTLAIQGDRILLPCLQKIGSHPHKDAILLPFNFMAYIFDKNPCAYMKISSDQKDMAYVFVRVDLETFWGRQFIEMCTGTQGYSYRNSRFFRICRTGKTGDHIWTGDYSMNDGSGGAQVLGDDGEPLHTNPKPIVQGLMAARYGYQDRSTIFRIYIGENDTSASKKPLPLDVCAFGYVEDGMQYFCHMGTLSNITKGLIKDVGRNLSLN